MTKVLTHALGVLGGPTLLAIGFVLVRGYVLKDRDVLDMTPKPKDEAEYRKDRARAHRTYSKQMDRYASRLLWGSGGAFVVSYSAVQFLGKPETYEPGAGWYLLVGWLLLVLAALAVVGNPYASSRMAAHAKTAIIAIHKNDEARAKVSKRTSEGWGKLTKRLNEVTFFCLALALWYLCFFFALNSGRLVRQATPATSASPTAVPGPATAPVKAP